MSPTITQAQIDTLLAVVRLGDADRLGWWRSHSVDETAEYVLAHALPNTWMATGVELAMESARIRHSMALDRPTAPVTTKSVAPKPCRRSAGQACVAKST
jgi:hypothetical protein